MKMFASFKSLMLIATIALLTGCAASVPMASKDQDAASKTFSAPSADKAGVYIFRENAHFGKALTKNLFIDDTVIGATAPGVYFHKEVTPGEHTVTTQAEFGVNSVKFTAESGKNYFFQQYMKWGTFQGSAGIQAVTEEVGKQNVLQCNEAK